MSKIFYDHLIVFERLEVHINSTVSNHEEKHELWEIIDKLVHNRVISKILEILPNRHHDEFAELLHNRPYDKNIIDYLDEASNKNIEEHIRKEIEELEKEIIQDLEKDE